MSLFRSSNDLSAIRGDILKRCIFISVDNQIGYQYNTDDHKRMIVNLRKGMHNALYREYCRRMLEKSDELVKNIQDGNMLNCQTRSICIQKMNI